MSPRRFLIVYGTSYGQTAKIARYIRDVLVDDGHEVTLEDASGWRGEWDVRRYDAVIVGGSIVVGNHQKSVREFVAANRDPLNRMPTAFFSVSASVAGTDARAIADVDRIINEFLTGAQWHPNTIEKIAGAIAYTKYSWLMRQVMRWISWRNAGPTDTSRDHELTDWAQVRRFAQRVAALVETPPLAQR